MRWYVDTESELIECYMRILVLNSNLLAMTLALSQCSTDLKYHPRYSVTAAACPYLGH